MTNLAMPVDAETPMYFGPRGELFGSYHCEGTPARKAVLLCPSLGQEQIRCHRLYRQLARALAAEGIAVLRFDYYGCGDSAGASAQTDWLRCLADTRDAAHELRRRSRTDHVVAFGARLGGSIALATAATARFTDLVLWDPILEGKDHVVRMDASQDALWRDPKRFSLPRQATDAAEQWLGFAVSAGLRQQLMTWQSTPSPVPTFVLDSLAPASSHNWHSLGTEKVRVKTVQPATPWDDLSRLEMAILSHTLIQAVVTHLRELT